MFTDFIERLEDFPFVVDLVFLPFNFILPLAVQFGSNYSIGQPHQGSVEWKNFISRKGMEEASELGSDARFIAVQLS
jgi:hypothetical protein